MFSMSLRPMFSTIAEKYDLLNRLFTLGLDEVWRKYCAKECASGKVIVDLCCGSGDLTKHILKYAGSDAWMIDVDFTKPMLLRSVSKNARKRGRVSFIISDVAHLPFKDGSVDCIGMSFAFRNLTYKNAQAMAYMRETVRILRRGGKFVSVESSQPGQGLLSTLYHLYFLKVVPFIGWLVSRQKSPYKYLSLSITSFPSAQEIAAMLLKAGFKKVSFKRFNFGTVALHTATK